eukprot:Gb_30899 [translate_table: standard]
MSLMASSGERLRLRGVGKAILGGLKSLLSGRGKEEAPLTSKAERFLEEVKKLVIWFLVSSSRLDVWGSSSHLVSSAGFDNAGLSHSSSSVEHCLIALLLFVSICAVSASQGH